MININEFIFNKIKKQNLFIDLMNLSIFNHNVQVEYSFIDFLSLLNQTTHFTSN